MWQLAWQEDVPLSLNTYFAYATDIGLGSAQPGRTVVYGTTSDGTKLELDVWEPETALVTGLRPAIVKVHGGGFTEGARSELPNWNRWLNNLGYVVFDVDYRNPPTERHLDQVGDVKCALGWVAANAAKYHVDPAHQHYGQLHRRESGHARGLQHERSTAAAVQ